MFKHINVAFSFILEVVGIIILSYWGFHFPFNRAVQIILGIGLPLILIVIWGIWCAPSSEHRLAGISLIFLKCILFGIITLCLIHRKHELLGIIFAVSVIINLGISAYFHTI